MGWFSVMISRMRTIRTIYDFSGCDMFFFKKTSADVRTFGSRHLQCNLNKNLKALEFVFIYLSLSRLSSDSYSTNTNCELRGIHMNYFSKYMPYKNGFLLRWSLYRRKTIEIGTRLTLYIKLQDLLSGRVFVYQLWLILNTKEI